MANKAIHWVLAGIFLFAWFYVAYSGYYSEDGNVSAGWLAVSLLTIALMRK